MALLNGSLKPEQNEPAGTRHLGVSVKAAGASYARPFFWAPFVLIGNWR